MLGAGLLPMVSNVAQSIQLALAPAFLLAGMSGFLNVAAGRLGRVVDRSRALAPLVWTTHGTEHDRIVSELQILDRRIQILNRSILMSVLCASSLCLVIILLFASAIVRLPLELIVSILFIAAMIALLCAFILFIREIGLGGRLLRIRPEVLTHEAEEQDGDDARS